MGKFSKYSSTRHIKERSYKIHPVWQGIGCIMMVLIPVMSYAGATLLVVANARNRWVPMPPEFYGPRSNPGLYGELFVAVLLSVLGYLGFVIFYSIMYKTMAPKQTVDAPMPKKRKKMRQSKSA
jgi:hypothetical protein